MAEKINSTEQLDLLLADYTLKSTETNNYLLKDEFEELISAGNLFFKRGDQNLFFFVLKEGFYRLYYHINNTDEPVKADMSLPVVLEVIYRGKKNYPHEMASFWNANGYETHLTRDNLSLTALNAQCLNPSFTGIRVESRRDAPTVSEVKKLFDRDLDIYTGDRMSISELQQQADKGGLLCAYDDGLFVGALQYEVKNKIVWLGHIAVTEAARGKGVAKHLINRYINENRENDRTRYQLWVIDENRAAYDLYLKYGFVYMNRSTTSFLKIK